MNRGTATRSHANNAESPDTGTRSAARRLLAPGLAVIAVTYGLARYSYGLFVPSMRAEFGLSPAILGVLAAGSYIGYCITISLALVFTAKVGPRFMIIAAGLVATFGIAMVAVAPTSGILAAGILVAGSATGLASPPMSDAVARHVVAGKQDRANSVINSGTSIGVAISGPAALLVAERWRLAWVGFTVVGLGVLIWTIVVLPKRDEDQNRAQPKSTAPAARFPLRYLFSRSASGLFSVAAGVGGASAAYWTFSRELVSQSGQLSETGSTLFWTFIGISGFAGAGAGHLVARYGVGRALLVSFLAMAAANALLAAAPGVLPLSYLSAALFGSAYVTLSGIVLVWSVGVFDKRPSAGLGAAFLLLAIGQAIGSPIAGAIAGATSMSTIFFGSAGFAVVLACRAARSTRAGVSSRPANNRSNLPT